MKKALLIGGIVVVALAAAGVVYGPRLYRQAFAPSTPYGAITKVETVESLPGGENEAPLQAPSGHQLWVIHFQPPPEEEGKASATPQPQPEDARLIDTTGEKHTPIKMMGQIKMKEDPGKPGWVTLDMQIESLVFALPADRKPQSFQVGAGPAVGLP